MIAHLQRRNYCHILFIVLKLEVSSPIGNIMKKSLYSSENQPRGNDSRDCSLTYERDADQVWYLVHCKPNSEQIAFRNLRNQGFSAFLPLQKLTKRKSISFQAQVRPLFPGYMFVAQNPNAGQWRKINNTRGVARLVCLGLQGHAQPWAHTQAQSC